MVCCSVQSQSQGGSGLGGAGIAGIVIGVVAALCLLAGVVALALRCRGSGRGRSPDMKGPPVPEHSFNKPGRYADLVMSTFLWPCTLCWQQCGCDALQMCYVELASLLL